MLKQAIRKQEIITVNLHFDKTITKQTNRSFSTARLNSSLYYFVVLNDIDNFIDNSYSARVIELFTSTTAATKSTCMQNLIGFSLFRTLVDLAFSCYAFFAVLTRQKFNLR